MGLEQQVFNGAALFDEKIPGWADRVTRQIDMAAYNECIVGQVCGIKYVSGADVPREQYEEIVKELGLTIEPESTRTDKFHGFYPDDFMDFHCRADALWQYQINLRKSS